MRKIFFVITLIVMALSAQRSAAQYYLSPSLTYFNPINFQSYTEPVDYNMGQGLRFVGTKHTGTNNGQVISVSYFGSAIFPDGGRIISAKAGFGFNQNLQAENGTFWEIEPDGQVTQIEMRNGQQMSEFKVNRQYYIEDNCIVFPKTQAELEAEAAAYGNYNYNSGSYSTPSSSSSGSDYNRHSATCMGCKGTGRCQHCNGEGTTWVNGHKIKCDLCHGTGRCQSCAGMGKIYGSF